jgi:DNA-binding response OmpR family regulator
MRRNGVSDPSSTEVIADRNIRASRLKNHSALVVEKEAALQQAMLISLIGVGMDVKVAGSSEDAARILDHYSPDVLIVDFDYPEGHNARLIEIYRERLGRSDQPVIVTTMQRLAENWRRMCEPISVLYKPFDIRLLIKMLTSKLAEEVDRGDGE